MARFEEQKAHYESLIGLFKYIITITLSLLTLFGFFIGYLTYQDGKEMRDDLRARKLELKESADEMKIDLKDREDKVSIELQELSNKVNNQIALTRSEALDEIENIKNTSSSLAEQEAKKRINEVFEYKNLNDYIEKIAEERIEPRVNQIVDFQISENAKKKTKEAISNLASNNQTSISKGVAYLTSNNWILLSDKELESIINIIEDKSTNGNYLTAINSVLLCRNSAIIAEYYRKILDDFAIKPYITYHEQSYKILSAYSYFVPLDNEYNYLKRHLQKRIQNSIDNIKAGQYESFLTTYVKKNKYLIIKLLDEKDIIDLIFQSSNKNDFKDMQLHLHSSLEKTLDESEFNSTYLFML